MAFHSTAILVMKIIIRMLSLRKKYFLVVFSLGFTCLPGPAFHVYVPLTDRFGNDTGSKRESREMKQQR